MGMHRTGGRRGVRPGEETQLRGDAVPAPHIVPGSGRGRRISWRSSWPRCHREGEKRGFAHSRQPAGGRRSVEKLPKA